VYRRLAVARRSALEDLGKAGARTGIPAVLFLTAGAIGLIGTLVFVAMVEERREG